MVQASCSRNWGCIWYTTGSISSCSSSLAECAVQCRVSQQTAESLVILGRIHIEEYSRVVHFDKAQAVRVAAHQIPEGQVSLQLFQDHAGEEQWVPPL